MIQLCELAVKGIRMRQIKIGPAKSLVWVAASLALWCGSSAPALAQTFDFTFSGAAADDSGLITNGILTLNSSGHVTTASGTLSGVSPGNDGGAFQLFYSYNGNYYNSSNDYHFEFAATTSGGGDTIEIDSGNTSEIFTNDNSTYMGLSTVNEQTPAPIPGSGPLSYLVLGFGGLFINRKRLSRAARMAADKLG
jgi:hypothetical protein